MIIYILILILVYVLSLINSRKINKLDFIFFLFLAALSGFRYEVGTDFLGYQRYFDLIEAGLEAPAEPGFIFISKVILYLNLNVQVLFLTFSILTMIFLYKGIKYYSDNEYLYKPVLYVLLLLYTFFPSLNVVRQILAAVVLLYASRYIINRSMLKFVFWVLVASLFHSSSVVFVALYFIALKNFRRFTMITLLIISLFLANAGIITSSLEYIHYNLNFLDVGGYIEKYLESSYNAKEFNFGIVFSINFFVLIIFILLKDRLITNERTQLIFNFHYLYILSYILAIDAFAFSRFNYFFGIYMAISISRFGILFDNESRKIVEYVILGLYSLLYLYVIIFQPAHDIIPYDFNFNLRNLMMVLII